MATKNAANSYITVSSANVIGMPEQPAFLATLSTKQDDVTGNVTWYTIVCDTVIKDQGSDYNNSTGIFTAPKTGAYVFSTGSYLSGTTALVWMVPLVQTSNRFYQGEFSRSASNADARCATTCFADMDAADTAYAVVIGAGESSATDDLECVSGADTRTYFSGYLAV